LIFEASGVRRLKDGVFLSEIPGDVNVAEDGIIVSEPDPVVHRMIGQWSGTRDTGERPTYGGWGGAQADATPYDQMLAIGGRRFDTGIGILSQSRLEVRNTGQRGRFEALVGIDDSTRNTQDRAQFLVYGDGRLIASSPAMAFGDPARALAADTRGIKVIELVVRTRSKKSGMPLVATWADAALR
jgi:alpha-galactosidase